MANFASRVVWRSPDQAAGPRLQLPASPPPKGGAAPGVGAQKRIGSRRGPLNLLMYVALGALQLHGHWTVVAVL